ncbi:MAG: M12 family metallo-peptidase [Phycisphaera sp.]|nr:MAG: M12 family metallo-peptidase [Phycisphaera sp.]
MKLHTSLCAAVASFMFASTGVAADQTTVEFARQSTQASGVAVTSIDAAPLARREAVRFARFPLPDGATADLNLEPFRVFAPGARIVVVDEAGQRPADFDPASITFWRGSVEGRPGSHVFLSVADGSTIGRIEMGASQPTYVVSSNGGDPRNGGVALGEGQIVVFEAAGTFGPQIAPTLCGTATGTHDSIAPVGPYTPAPAGGLRMARLAVDSDFAFYELFNDERAALTYLAQLYATTSDLTIRDVNVRLDLIFLRLFITRASDPYEPTGATFPGAIPREIDRDVAQLMSGRKDASAGGRARICGSDSWVAYATGQMSSPTSPGIFNQDIRIAAHEIGHNLGAPHTHDRGVDRCDIADSRPQRGTIQSYCAQTFSGRAALTDLHYHTRMRQEINDCSPRRLVFDCNQNYLDDTLDIMMGTSQDANANGIPDECEDCNANGILDTEDIAAGSSSDLNLNGIPDECEPDCNANGIPDDLDIANGNDENGDGIPDECQADRDGNGVPDWTDIFRDMSLDIDRDGVLDATQDCDGDGIMDIDALDHAHSLWAVSSGDGMVKEYHYRSGVLRAEAGENVLVDPTDVLITTDRRVLVADAGNASVVELDREGVYVRHLVRPGSGGLVAPSAMAFAPDGSLLVADQGGDAVLRYDLDTGAFRGVFIEAGAGGLVGPRAMAFKPEGNLFVTTDDARVLEFDRDSGAFVRVFITIEPDPDPRTIREPRGILFLPRPAGQGVRCLVACEYWIHGGIYEFHADTGTLIGQWNEGDLNFKLRHPWGLRLGPDGNVYVSSANLHARTAPPPAGELGPHTAGLHLTRPHIFQYDGVSGKLTFAYVQGGDSKLDHPKGFDFMPGPLDRNANAIPDACESVCIADCDRSGTLDILDFLCFQSAFMAGEPAADCTGDGSIDIFDFLCFQGAFEDGCR